MEIEGCALPDDRRYDVENDVWLAVDAADGAATLGLTLPLASFAGRFESVTYRPPVDRVEAGRSVATVESRRYTGPVRLPVAATVVATNPAIVAAPKLLNNAPYDAGWVVRLRLLADLPGSPVLMTSAEAAPIYAERIRTKRIRCYPAVPDAELFEIGAECQAILVRLNEEIARRAPEEVVLLVTDDPTSPIEMVRWSDTHGHPVLATRVEDGLYHFLIRRATDPTPRRRSVHPATASRSAA
ncbi:MAG TPA: sulfurtransferase TusA family protein [Thermoplasmata archaeon]|nr:sulfurtransferase TusA family protein [Thermoplasmata archaeon]